MALIPTAHPLRLGLMLTLVIISSPAMAQSILLNAQTATYGNPWPSTGTMDASTRFLNTRTLVTPNVLPANSDVEILGRIDVQAPWFGSTSKATKLLAEKAKSLGGNAVVESRVWQAPAFPAIVAAHGTGIAVHIKDHELLKSLANSASSWESP